MVEQMPKNDSNDLEDKVRTLQEQNAKLIQILRSQGCPVDSLISTENQSNLIQPINVVPLESISTILTTPNNVFLSQTSTTNDIDQHQISIRPKPISNDVLPTKVKSETSNVESTTTTNLLDNESNHKHPRPIRPKPSLQLFNSLTLNESKPMLNNVLTPSALINNTNSSTSFDESSSSQTKKFSKSRPRIRKPISTPIPIAPNLGRPLAPAPLNVQRIVTTTIKRSSSHNVSKKRSSKSLVSRSPPTDRFAESISGLMKDFDQELIASNFLSTPPSTVTTTNILSQQDFPAETEPMSTLISDDEMRLVEMNFDETTFLKQFEFDDHLYPRALKSTTTDSIYPGSSLIKNNVFTTIVPLSMQNSLESNRIDSKRFLPEEGVRLTARHIEPSQVATYESTKYPDILDDLVTVTDHDVLTHVQSTTTTNEFSLNLFERTTEETSNQFDDLQYFYPTKQISPDEENSSPKSDVEPTITDLSSIIQIGQNHSSPTKQIENTSVVHRIVFEPILSPPMTSSTDENLSSLVETSTNNEQYSQSSSRSTTFEMKNPTEKRRKSSSNAEQIDSSTSLNHQIPPTPGDYDETYVQQIHSNDDQMNQTMFITPPPDHDHHEQKSSSDEFQHLKKSKKDHFDCSTTNSQYRNPITTSIIPNQVDPYAQTYHQYHSTNNSSTPFFHYPFNSHSFMNSQTSVTTPPPPPPSTTTTQYYHPTYHQPSYIYHPHPTYHPNSNYMSSHDHHSYNR